MLISPVSANVVNQRSKQRKSQFDFVSSEAILTRSSFSPCNAQLMSQNRNQHFNKILSFLGYKVKLVDGGQHAKDLYYFAKALSSDIDIERVDVELNPIDPLVKQMSSLKTRLREINDLPQDKKPEYLAIPMSCAVPLLNLSDQLSAVTQKTYRLTPKNVASSKNEIINFLKIISENPYENRNYIGYMDKIGQGVEHAYGVIQEINKAVKSGIKVYIPADHPEQATLKWLAGEKNLKPELYKFISTGFDTNGSVSAMRKEIQSNNWYNFNLLNLSDAVNVNLKTAENEDHLFSAYDTCLNEGTRGIYHFTPIRENGKVTGFSYLDESTLQYPIAEYGKHEKVEQLTKFVGLPLSQSLATLEEHAEFKSVLAQKGNLDKFNNKLFSVNKIFTPDEIKTNKLDLRGDFVDASFKMFFKENRRGQVIFPAVDYEQSGVPSVASMWGGCFSTIKAITENIKLKKTVDNSNNIMHFKNQNYDDLIRKASGKEAESDYHYSVYLLRQAVEIKRLAVGENNIMLTADYEHLGDNLAKSFSYPEAETFYNKALNIAKVRFNPKDKKIADYYYKIASTCLHQGKYVEAEGCLNEALDIYCFNRTDNSGSWEKIIEIFNELGYICKSRGKINDANVCFDAANEISHFTLKGTQIVSKRADGVRCIS